MSEQKRRMLSEWRAGKFATFQLPSGLVVKLRKPTMTDLLLTGQLPPGIAHLADEASKGGGDSVDVAVIMQNAEEMRVMLDVMAKLAIVDPEIADVPDDDHITLSEISGDDKMAIFNFVNGGSQEVRPFRVGEDEPASAPRRRRSVRETAKRDPGTDGPVDGVPVG
jgi:hypothetical protein